MKDKTIIFDLDGTLIDSAPDVCRALNRALAGLDRRPHTVDEVKGYLGFGARILMEKALNATGTEPAGDVIDELTTAFLDDYALHPVVDTVVFPGVTQVIEELMEKGARLAICTNKPSITAAPVLDALDLSKYFDVVVCGDQVENKKPHGGHVLDTIEAAGGERSRSIMVGDSENDIDAAIHASVRSVVVSFGYAHAPHAELGADAIIDRFQDLPGVLQAIFHGD